MCCLVSLHLNLITVSCCFSEPSKFATSASFCSDFASLTHSQSQPSSLQIKIRTTNRSTPWEKTDRSHRVWKLERTISGLPVWKNVRTRTRTRTGIRYRRNYKVRFHPSSDKDSADFPARRMSTVLLYFEGKDAGSCVITERKVGLAALLISS